MGSIIVGQKKQQTVDMGGVTIVPNQNITSGKKQELSAEEKARIVKNIMALPKDQIVPELRKHGFTDIADITEAQMKEAKKLSEELAAEQNGESSGKTEDTTAEDGNGDKTAEAGDGDGETEPEKKKVGRPKKSKE